MRFFVVILATAGMTLLLIDSEVFTRFHLHLNPIVWQLVINPDENEMARDWQLMFIGVPVILLLELVFATWSWQKLRSLTHHQRLRARWPHSYLSPLSRGGLWCISGPMPTSIARSPCSALTCRFSTR